MKNIFSPFAKLVALAACALSLGSCSRAEYAMLPKGSSYHGVTRVATPVPAAASSTSATPAPLAETVAATAPAAATPKAPSIQVAKNAAQPVAVSAAAPGTISAVSVPAAAPGPKLSIVQRLALNKVTRKVDKLIQKTTARQHDNTASTAKTTAVSGNLRTGLIFLLVGLLVSLFSGISGIFGIIGGILAIIGLVFIILWLLDQA